MADQDSQTVASDTLTVTAGGTGELRFGAGDKKFISFLEIKLATDGEEGSVFATATIVNENDEPVRDVIEPMNGDSPGGYPYLVSPVSSPLAVFREIKATEELVVKFNHNDAAGNDALVFANASNAATIRATELSG